MVYNRPPIIDALGVSKKSKNKRAVSGVEFHNNFKKQLAKPGVYIVRPKGQHNKNVVKVGKAENLGRRTDGYNRIYLDGMDVLYVKPVDNRPVTEQGQTYQHNFEAALKKNVMKGGRPAEVPLIPGMLRSTEMFVISNAALARAVKKTEKEMQSVPRGPKVRQLANPLPRAAKNKKRKTGGVATRSQAPPEDVPWWQVSTNVVAIREAEKKAKVASKKRVANRPCMCPCPCP